MDLRVRLVADRLSGQAIYCNEDKFPSNDLRSYQAVKNHILSFRKNRENYPFHITEIDVPSELLGIKPFEQHQSLHYLNYKQKVEDKLNL